MSPAELYMDSVKQDVNDFLPKPVAKLIVPKPAKEDILAEKAAAASAQEELKSQPPPQGQQVVVVP